MKLKDYLNETYPSELRHGRMYWIVEGDVVILDTDSDMVIVENLSTCEARYVSRIEDLDMMIDEIK